MEIIWYRKADQDLNNNIAYIALKSPHLHKSPTNMMLAGPIAFVFPTKLSLHYLSRNTTLSIGSFH